MNLYSFSVLNFSFGALLTAILIVIKRKDQISTRFFFFSMVVCGWGYFFSFFITQSYSQEMELLLVRLCYVFVIFIPITWLRFVFEFLNQKEPFPFFYTINEIIAFACALACPTPLMFEGISSFRQYKYLPIPGIMHHLHAVQFFSLVPLGFYNLIKSFEQSVGEKKDQLKYFIAATVVGFVAGGTIYLVYYRIPCPLYLLVLMPLYPILMAVSLIKYGLFDVQRIADAFQREKITALGIMAASLNHEMRNPLYIAKGKIEAYRDSIERQHFDSAEKEKRTEETVNAVASQLDRTLDIMQRFSDFARPEHMTKRENLNLKELFQEASELVSYEILRNKAVLKMESEQEAMLYANKRQMEEILVNLMINSSQSLGDNGGEIRLKGKKTAHKITVEVSDNGPGMNEETQKRIFDPFFSTKGEKGSGLGLYITKQLVEKNGGKIEVRSKPGASTSFILTFDLNDVQNRGSSLRENVR
jgi:signal transduction histidine kinase